MEKLGEIVALIWVDPRRKSPNECAKAAPAMENGLMPLYLLRFKVDACLTAKEDLQIDFKGSRFPVKGDFALPVSCNAVGADKRTQAQPS